MAAGGAAQGFSMRLKSFVIAPVFLLLGVIAMKFGWKPNPDLGWGVALPLWTGAHLAYVAGIVAFGFVLATVWAWARDAARSRTERGVVHLLGALGAVGVVAMLGQMVIDLIVGFSADSRAGMSSVSDRYHDIPGFDAFFYGTIPALYLAATALLVVVLAVRRRVAVSPAVLFFAGSVAIGTQLTALMVTGGVAVGVALFAIAREEQVGARVPVGVPS